MNFDILDNKPLEFYNEAGELVATIFVSSSGDFHLSPVSSSNQDVIIGDRNTVGDVEIGLPSAETTLKLMGGGTISANGGTLTLGDFSIGDKLVANTASLNVNGTRRTLYTTSSIAYSGTNIIHVTQSFTDGTEQKTIFNYSGDDPTSIIVSGSDGINKVYTLAYDGSNVTQITVT
jgi:hypothetical protein